MVIDEKARVPLVWMAMGMVPLLTGVWSAAWYLKSIDDRLTVVEIALKLKIDKQVVYITEKGK